MRFRLVQLMYTIQSGFDENFPLRYGKLIFLCQIASKQKCLRHCCVLIMFLPLQYRASNYTRDEGWVVTGRECVGRTNVERSAHIQIGAVVLLNVIGCRLTYEEQAETDAEAWFNIASRPRKPQGSLHLDSHTASEL